MSDTELPDIVGDLEFKAFGKIPRLNRECTITEKIDGTNAAIQAHTYNYELLTLGHPDPAQAVAAAIANPPKYVTAVVDQPDDRVITYLVAQSRKRIITPDRDNYGFAGYVAANAAALAATLGDGIHFGEWWGSGIQRRYGMAGKKFSLFNTARWNIDNTAAVPALGVVPTLYEGPFSTGAVQDTIEKLREFGSVAAPGFEGPEGVIVYHHAANSYAKVTVTGDEEPKEVRERRLAHQSVA